MELHFTIGLPGSGKTDWAKKQNCYIVDVDDCLINAINKESVIKSVTDRINSKLYYERHCKIIVDGLFSNCQQIYDIISNIKNSKCIDKVYVHYWKPDIETCLFNDTYRRTISAAVTIKNMTINKPTDSELSALKINDETIVELVEHEVKRKPDFIVFFKDKNVDIEEFIIKSEAWKVSGNWRNCWGDDHQVEAESPVEFTEYDEIINKVWPDITHIEYKRMFDDCVQTESNYETDYYQGTINYEYYSVNLESLHYYINEKMKKYE